MTKHELKIWPVFFEPVRSGEKTFEHRNNDRCFQRGDIVVLREWDEDKKWEKEEEKYTGRTLTFKIGYVYPTGHDNNVVFSLLPEEHWKIV